MPYPHVLEEWRALQRHDRAVIVVLDGPSNTLWRPFIIGRRGFASPSSCTRTRAGAGNCGDIHLFLRCPVCVHHLAILG